MQNDTDYTHIEYLGITEAADYLRVSASTLRRWEKKGFLIPERTPTGIRRYTKQQLDAVLQAPHSFDHPYFSHQPSSSQAGSHSFRTADFSPPSSSFVAEDSSSYITSNITPPSQSPSQDEDLHDLRDFFVRAGYTDDRNELQNSSPDVSLDEFDDSAHDQNNDFLIQNISSHSEFSSDTVQTYDAVDSLSKTEQAIPSSSDSSHVYDSFSHSLDPSLHPSVDSLVLPELPSLPQFDQSSPPDVHLSPSSSSLHSSGVFHEEHAASFLDYMRKDREVRSQHESSSLPVQSASLSNSSHSHVVSPPPPGGTSSYPVIDSPVHAESNVKRILFFVGGVFVVITVVFVGLALYSYVSSPPPLYNPVVE